LTSFFVRQDSKLSFAQDESELCELCAKVVRLAYLYSNDAMTQSTWSDSTTGAACQFVENHRQGDCSKLASAVVAAQQDYFSGSDAKFSSKEQSGTTEQLGLLVDQRSYGLCKTMGCCPINPKADKKVLTPTDTPGDSKDLEVDRKALQDDKFLLDSTQEAVFQQRRENNDIKAKLDLRTQDLNDKDTKLKADQAKLAKDNLDLAEAQAAEKAAEAAEQKREADDAKFEADLKAKEVELTTRENIVKTREIQLAEKTGEDPDAAVVATDGTPAPTAAPTF
jgi:nucleotide-binding universal stress UspA family protein